MTRYSQLALLALLSGCSSDAGPVRDVLDQHGFATLEPYSSPVKEVRFLDDRLQGVEYSQEEFPSLTQQGGVAVMFSAPWCMPCKAGLEWMAYRAMTSPDMRYVVVDVDQAKELSDKFRVSSIPAYFLLQEDDVTAPCRIEDEGMNPHFRPCWKSDR